LLLLDLTIYHYCFISHENCSIQCEYTINHFEKR
jgi:hypothetical protein